MARVKGAMMTRKRRNKTLKLAKSYWGSKSTHFKMAKQAVMKSGVYAYVGRKQKKREFRQLWIARISAAVAPLLHACRSFSVFTHNKIHCTFPSVQWIFSLFHPLAYPPY